MNTLSGCLWECNTSGKHPEVISNAVYDVVNRYDLWMFWMFVLFSLYFPFLSHKSAMDF